MSLYNELVKVQLANQPSNEEAAQVAVAVFVAWLQDHQTLHKLEKLGLSESLEQIRRGEVNVIRPKENK